MCIAWAGDAIRIIAAKTESIVKHFSNFSNIDSPFNKRSSGSELKVLPPA
jgi:hypothetical protein